jgi:hypothetical protein
MPAALSVFPTHVLISFREANRPRQSTASERFGSPDNQLDLLQRALLFYPLGQASQTEKVMSGSVTSFPNSLQQVRTGDTKVSRTLRITPRPRAPARRSRCR